MAAGMSISQALARAGWLFATSLIAHLCSTTPFTLLSNCTFTAFIRFWPWLIFLGPVHLRATRLSDSFCPAVSPLISAGSSTYSYSVLYYVLYLNSYRYLPSRLVASCVGTWIFIFEETQGGFFLVYHWAVAFIVLCISYPRSFSAVLDWTVRAAIFIWLSLRTVPSS